MSTNTKQSHQETTFSFPKQTQFYKGKVRDVYTINDELLVMVASDRISAFDVVLPKPIPFKGQVLNQLAATFLEATKDIVPNWMISSPDPNVTVGKKCDPFKVEMVIRGYLAGHAWRTYASGLRQLCGVSLPDGMQENEKFTTPIITPTTKASEGHDEDISKEAIIANGIVSEEEYQQLEDYTHKIFQRGTEIAAKQGLILVDTKYEFGKLNGQIYLIDEIHTPDSSRYFYADGYSERLKNNQPQRQLSKEFVREWLMTGGFQGKENQIIPEMTTDFINLVTERYIELFEKVSGKTFIKSDQINVNERIHQNVSKFLEHYYLSK